MLWGGGEKAKAGKEEKRRETDESIKEEIGKERRVESRAFDFSFFLSSFSLLPFSIRVLFTKPYDLRVAVRGS